MSTPRFFLTPADWHDGELRLGKGEAAHSAQVLRMQPGDHVEVFDGTGRVARGALATVSKSEVLIAATTVRRFQPLTPRIHLWAAVIKGERMDWLLEKAVELGVHSVRPLQTAHCVARLKPEQVAKKMEKWHHLLVAAAKQCHIPFLPELHEPASLEHTLAIAPPPGVRLIAALTEHQSTIADIATRPEFDDITIAIGPEGDFTPEELSLALDHDFKPVTLGPLILRAETAAVVALSRLTSHRRSLIEASIP